MKLTFLLFIAIMLVTAECRPKEKKPTKDKKKLACTSACPTNYEPVCAKDPSDPSSRARIFGNACVLGLHNCENQSKLESVNMSECKGSGGVRLS